MRKLLSKFGFDAVMVENGQLAVEAFRQSFEPGASPGPLQAAAADHVLQMQWRWRSCWPFVQAVALRAGSAQHAGQAFRNSLSWAESVAAPPAASDAAGFDLIIMDLNMPVMDGCEASSLIRGLVEHGSCRHATPLDTAPRCAMLHHAVA